MNHFPLPFIDQMLERLAGHAYYCFLDGYFGYSTQELREDYLHLLIWDICLPSHAFWVMQCTCHFLVVHD